MCLWLIFANCLLRTHLHVWKQKPGLFEEDENNLWLDLCYFLNAIIKRQQNGSTFQNGRSVNASIMFIQTSWTIKERVKVFEEIFPCLNIWGLCLFQQIQERNWLFLVCVVSLRSSLISQEQVLWSLPSERCCHRQTPLCKTSPNNVCLHFHLFISEKSYRNTIFKSMLFFLLQPNLCLNVSHLVFRSREKIVEISENVGVGGAVVTTRWESVKVLKWKWEWECDSYKKSECFF